MKNWAALIWINTITNFGNSLNYFARADYASDLFIVTKDMLYSNMVSCYQIAILNAPLFTPMI